MKTKSGNNISKIGLGSYGIGGRGHRDMTLTEKHDDEIYVDTLVYTLEKGINFTEIALGYSHGNALRLFKQALDKSSLNREDIFITSSLYTRDFSSIGDVHKDVNDFFTVMETNYADSTLVTQSLLLKFGKELIYDLLHDLLDAGKTRYVSLSNAGIKTIKEFKEEFGNKFFAHEGHISFEIRAMQDEGIFDLCNSLDVYNIIWRPLRRNQTMQLNWELLKTLSEKYTKTQNQIVLNWMVHEGYYPMVMSSNKQHVDENISSLDFEITAEEYKAITDFRPPGYSPPAIDWESSVGTPLVTMINDFNEQR